MPSGCVWSVQGEVLNNLNKKMKIYLEMAYPRHSHSYLKDEDGDYFRLQLAIMMFSLKECIFI